MLKVVVKNFSGVTDTEIDLDGPMAVLGTIRQGKTSVTRDALEFVMTGSARKYVKKAKGADPTVLLKDKDKAAIVQLIQTSEAGDLVLERKVTPSGKMSVELTLDGMPRGGKNADDKLEVFCEALGGVQIDLLKYIFNPFTLVATNAQDLKKALQDHLAMTGPKAVEAQLAIFEDIPEQKRMAMAEDISRLGLKEVYESINQAQREAAQELKVLVARVTDEPDAVEIDIDSVMYNSKNTPLQDLSRIRNDLDMRVDKLSDTISHLRAECNMKPLYSDEQIAEMKSKKTTLETLIANTNSDIKDTDDKKSDYDAEFQSLANVGIGLRERKQVIFDRLGEYDTKGESLLAIVEAWETVASQDAPCCVECNRPWTDTDIANKVAEAQAELDSHRKTLDTTADKAERSEIDTELATNEIDLKTVKIKNADANAQNAASESALRDFNHKLEMVDAQIIEVEKFVAPDVELLNTEISEKSDEKAAVSIQYEKIVEVLGAARIYSQWVTANAERKSEVEKATKKHEVLKKQEAAVHPQKSAVSESFGSSGLQEFREIMNEVSSWLAEPVSLDDNYAIMYEDRPVMEGSTSEQYSAGIVVQTAIAMFAKFPVMVMDFGDTLQNKVARNKYLMAMGTLVKKGYFDAAVAVLSTEAAPEDIKYPKAYTVYHMENGVASMLQKGV